MCVLAGPQTLADKSQIQCSALWQPVVMPSQMYRAAVQQEQQHTPAFLRMQQEAAAKEAEEEAEKRRTWEEEVASKKFWVSHACHMMAIT